MTAQRCAHWLCVMILALLPGVGTIAASESITQACKKKNAAQVKFEIDAFHPSFESNREFADIHNGMMYVHITLSVTKPERFDLSSYLDNSGPTSTAPLATPVPAWAFPRCPSFPVPSLSDGLKVVRIPGSTLRVTVAEVADWSVTRDFFPSEHTPMPAMLASSRSRENPACGYCHLPTGSGRPENANLSGLSAPYILAQLQAFRDGRRKPAIAGWQPSMFMAKIAATITNDEAAMAAEYFSKQPVRAYVKVIESTRVPGYAEACFVLMPNGKERTSLGSAIIEMPRVAAKFEYRDPHADYIAYVPPGSIARGRRLARTGSTRTQACTDCHGANLLGGPNLAGPRLAGRFPTYLFRQLEGFKLGTRVSSPPEPMRSVAAGLTRRDMVDVAAYAASIH